MKRKPANPHPHGSVKLNGEVFMQINSFRFECKYIGKQGLDRTVRATITDVRTNESETQKFEGPGNNLARAFAWFTTYRKDAS